MAQSCILTPKSGIIDVGHKHLSLFYRAATLVFHYYVL